MNTTKTISIALMLVLIICGSAVAKGDLTGDEILGQLKDETALTGSGYAVIDLISVSKRGDQRESRLTVYRSDDGSTQKQLVEYMSPADVRGTKFLSISDEGNDEPEMWLYLPALGKERRIAGHMTKGSFMGTDFTYEEIAVGRDYADDYQAVRAEDEEFGGYLCYVLDLTPKDSNSEYSRVRMWVWQDEMMPLRVQFFDRDGQLSKRLVISDLRPNQSNEYTPHLIEMSNELAGTKSIIRVIETYDTVDEGYFTLRYLRK